MSFLFPQQRALSAQQLLADRRSGRTSSSSHITRDKALRHSATWACLRLRADLVSTMPVDVFRRVDGVQVELTKPPVLVNPGGPSGARLVEHMYSTQWDLDSCGNTFGIITAFDGQRLPSVIELVNADSVIVRRRKGKLTYSIGGSIYQPEEIWHEKQFTVSGVPVGLDPISYAAMSINTSLNAQQFAADWFSNSGVPASHLKNTNQSLTPEKADAVKARFKAAIAQGDVFVSGKDWDYNVLAAKENAASWLDQQESGVADVCRFLGVPGDLVDAPAKGSSVTYANITQRNLQFLILNLGPAIYRREEAMSAGLLPKPRYLKLNPASLLRMDLASRYASYKVGIDGRFLAPSEARDYENLPPLTPEQEAEIARLMPSKQQTPTSPTGVTP